MFSMVISVFSEVISVDFGDFGESCYPRSQYDSDYQVPCRVIRGKYLIREKNIENFY